MHDHFKDYCTSMYARSEVSISGWDRITCSFVYIGSDFFTTSKASAIGMFPAAWYHCSLVVVVVVNCFEILKPTSLPLKSHLP